MIRTIGAILVIGASSAIGFIFSEALKKRVYQLRDIQGALIQLENEIYYTRTTLPEACLKVSQKTKYPINKVFEKVSLRLSNNSTDTVYEAFLDALDSKEDAVGIAKEDKDILLDLAKALGESDLEAHKKVFNLAERILKTKVEVLQLGVDKNVKMYRYLGFSLGAAVAIILI